MRCVPRDVEKRRGESEERCGVGEPAQGTRGQEWLEPSCWWAFVRGLLSIKPEQDSRHVEQRFYASASPTAACREGLPGPPPAGELSSV